MSVVVTTRNSARTLEACLSSVRRQSYPRVELVVVDNSSTDATPEIARRHCDVFATKGPERSAQRNHAVELSHGEFVAFIDSDMVLDEEVISEGVQAFEQHEVTGVIVPERSFGDGFWTKCRILERQCYIGDVTVEAARIFRRSGFLAAGGYDLELNGGEDWDLSKRLAGVAATPHTTSIIRHDEGRTTLRGAYVKRRYYAPGYLLYLQKHRSGAVGQGNAVLRPAFVRHRRALVRHPVLTAGMFTLKTVEMAAVLQVAGQQVLLGRKTKCFQPQPRRPPASLGQTSLTDGLAGVRPLMVTFGSVQQAHGGVQTRARLTAEVFADMGIPLTVVSTREPPLAELPPWASRLRVPDKKPTKGFSLALGRLIRDEAASSTVVIVTNAMLLPAVVASRMRLPFIWDTNECQTLHYGRLPPTLENRLKALAWQGLETWSAHRCSMAIAISGVEAATWRARYPILADKLAVVDHATLAAPRDPREARRFLEGRLGRSIPGPVLLFLGTMHAKHNAAAARWILDHLVGTLPPEVTVVFCGPGSDKLAPVEGLGAVIVGLGAVDDVDSVVAAADLCLAPLAAGAGVKTKVLHYLAHGKTVIGTPNAFEGVEGAPGLHSASMQDIPALVARMCGETESPAAAEQRVQAQQAWLDEFHGRAHVAEQWKQVLACLPTSKPA